MVGFWNVTRVVEPDATDDAVQPWRSATVVPLTETIATPLTAKLPGTATMMQAILPPPPLLLVFWTVRVTSVGAPTVMLLGDASSVHVRDARTADGVRTAKRTTTGAINVRRPRRPITLLSGRVATGRRARRHPGAAHRRSFRSRG